MKRDRFQEIMLFVILSILLVVGLVLWSLGK